MINDSAIYALSLSSLSGEEFVDNNNERMISQNSTTIITSDYAHIHYFVIRCLSIYALFLVIIGTLGNTVTIIVLCRPKLRRIVTMRYLIAVSIFDIISLYGWNFNNFYKFTISATGSNLEQLSLVHCRIFSFVTFVGLQLSSWCLTAVSLDRCLSIYFLSWKRGLGKLSRTKYYIGILTTFCLLLNSHILFFNGYRSDPPNSTVKCYATRTNSYYIFPQWERVHLVVYNLCPFVIMLSCNIYIIFITIRSARVRTTKSFHSSGKVSRSSNSRHRQLSFMLMLVTFAFVLLTLPSCLYFVFVRHRMTATNSSRSYRHMVQICLSSVQFTSHAINFFLYCFSATNFRNELYDLLADLCLHRCLFARSRQMTRNTDTIRLTTIRETKYTNNHHKEEMLPSIMDVKSQIDELQTRINLQEPKTDVMCATDSNGNEA